jgi:hypothetical protein
MFKNCPNRAFDSAMLDVIYLPVVLSNYCHSKLLYGASHHFDTFLYTAYASFITG